MVDPEDEEEYDSDDSGRSSRPGVRGRRGSSMWKTSLGKIEHRTTTAPPGEQDPGQDDLQTLRDLSGRGSRRVSS